MLLCPVEGLQQGQAAHLTEPRRAVGARERSLKFLKFMFSTNSFNVGTEML